MSDRFVKAWLGLVALGLVFPVVAAAQDDQEVVPEPPPQVEEMAEAAPDREEGWKYLLTIGANLSFASSNDVVGNVDGNTWTIGTNLNAGADFLSGPHEYRAGLAITESFTRTPTVDEFVKSADLLALETLYLYHFPGLTWFGPYARLALNAPIFAGSDVRAAAQTYVVANLDGTVTEVTADRLDLTDPFQPLTLAESAGVFLRPLAKPEINYEALIGFGARQTFADDQLAITDDDATAEIEVTELESFIQAGAALLTRFWGELASGKVNYETGADILIPFINDLPAGDDRSAGELTNVEIFAGLTFQLVEWASLDYRFQARREPQLIDAWQLQHSLLLTFTYAFVTGAEPPPATL